MSYLDQVAIPPATTGERRNHRRIQVLLSAAVEHERRTSLARLLDLSSGGLRLRFAEPVRVGDEVTLARGSVRIASKVVWTKGATAGLKFDQPIDEHAFLRFRRG
jgi:hypothetical protein